MGQDEKKPPEGGVVRPVRVVGINRFPQGGIQPSELAFERQVQACLKIQQVMIQAKAQVGDDFGPADNFPFKGMLGHLLARDLTPGDPAQNWSWGDVALVADFFMVALLSGHVPVPRSRPLVTTELQDLWLRFGGSGCLPPGTTDFPTSVE